MNGEVDQICVCLPLDSALFPDPLAEEKFTDALQRSLGQSYPEASILIERDPYVDQAQVRAKVADRDFNPDEVTDRVWYLKDLWRLAWEAVLGYQAGKLRAQ